MTCNRVEYMIYKRRIEAFSEVMQSFLIEMDNIPEFQARIINDLIQALGKNIEIVDQEFKMRVKTNEFRSDC